MGGVVCVEFWLSGALPKDGCMLFLECQLGYGEFRDRDREKNRNSYWLFKKRPYSTHNVETKGRKERMRFLEWVDNLFSYNYTYLYYVSDTHLQQCINHGIWIWSHDLCDFCQSHDLWDPFTPTSLLG